MSARPEPGELDPEIERVFPGRGDLARRYATLLSTDGIVRGVIGPREADRIWPRHLFNSAVLADLIPPSALVVDLGSGAGLPGIPLALARPDLTIVLLEPMARRVAFLIDVLAELRLPQVEVRRGRAESSAGIGADAIVARAVAPLSTLVEVALPLGHDNARLLALKGASAAGEAEEVARLARWRVRTHTLQAYGAPATVVEVRRSGND